MQNIGMLMSIWDEIASIVTGFFAIIPQTLYFLYTSAASVLDMLQYVMRKLAGLDVYYVNGEPQTGDIITEFVEGALGINSNYSILATVFWAMVIFGVVLLVLSTIMAMIKSHYNYDSQKSSPRYIIEQAFRGLLTMIIIPIATVFGLYLSEALLVALDRITNVGGGTNVSSIYESSTIDKFESTTINGTKSYGGFDFFGAHIWTNTYTFSSSIFRSATYNCNRVRTGHYTAVVGETNTYWSNAGVFWTDNTGETKETIAKQIDTAFEYALTLKDGQTLGLGGDSYSLATSFTGMSAVYALDLINVTTFSKFHVGLVWYYYDLWMFDFLLGYAGIITGVTLMFNLILGLISRLIYLVALFLVYPPVTGLYPFDGGNGVKSWRTSFFKSFFGVFSAIAALNIMCMILPFVRGITMFNIPLLDSIMTGLFVLVGLTLIKKVIAIFSGFIGAESIEESGGKMAKEFVGTVAKAVTDVMKLAGVGISAGKSLAISTKNHFVRRKLGKSPMARVTKEDRKKYDEQRKNEKQEKEAAKAKEKEQKRQERINQRAEELLAADKKNQKSKNKRQSKYAARARHELEADHPEFFKKGGQLNRKKIKMDDYKRMLSEKERELAIADATEEIDNEVSFKDRVANLFFQPAEQDSAKGKTEGGEEGSGDVETTRTRRKLKPNIKAAVDDVLDIAKMAFKLQGDLMGVSGMGKALEEAGAKDEFITKTNDFAKALGISTTGLKTKKQKEQEKEAEEKERVERFEETNRLYQTTNTEIESLVKKFESYYKKRLGIDGKQKPKPKNEKGNGKKD